MIVQDDKPQRHVLSLLHDKNVISVETLCEELGLDDEVIENKGE